jgi:hypothetical protein
MGLVAEGAFPALSALIASYLSGQLEALASAPSTRDLNHLGIRAMIPGVLPSLLDLKVLNPIISRIPVSVMDHL